MANKNKAKGTRAETRVVNYLNDHGLKASRKVLKGNKDEGDVDVVLSNGVHITIEVKAGKQTANPSRAQLNEWINQCKVEGSNSNTVCYLVIVRYQRRIEDAEVYLTSSNYMHEEYRMTHLDTFIRMLEFYQYGAEYGQLLSSLPLQDQL